MAEELGQAYGWDDQIKGGVEEFINLDPGIYPFEVTKLEKGKFGGSDKMAPSPMAKLQLKLTGTYQGKQAEAFANYNIILNQKMRNRLAEFFIGIGQIPENIGDNVWSPNWNNVVGASGHVKIAHREYNGNTYMDVKKILKPSEATKFVMEQGAAAMQAQTGVAKPVTPVAAQAPVLTQSAAQSAPAQGQQTFVAGNF